MAMAKMKAQMLWENIAQGALSAVHSLLESGNINLEERDENGQTFLMVASEQGELNIVRELLEAGLDPNAVDNENWTAMLCASKEGHLEIVIELLEHGAFLEHRDLRGWTALMWASYKGRTMVVQELLDRGANTNVHGEHNMTSLIFAAGRGYGEIVPMLLDRGAKVNTPDKYGTTPLIWACRKGYLEIVEMLLNEGANVDASGMHSWTALLVATKGCYTEVVHSLLEYDPNVNAIDKDGYTPLAIAAKEGLVETVAELLNKGAYINVADRANDTVLIHAVKAGHTEVVRILLAKHADVDVCGSEGRTALYAAVEKNHVDIVQVLLGSGPDLEIPTKDGDTPLLKSVRNRNEAIVCMLLDKGARVSASDKKGDTPLHIAFRARSKRITELLLRDPRHSRLLYRPNRAGETPYNMDSLHQRGILPQIFGHRQLNANDAENLLGYEIYSGALADILSEPSLVTPITVGLYAKWGSGKSFLISKLQSEMKSFTEQSTEEHLQLGVTVFFLTLLVSVFVGETLGLSVSWQVGLGVGLGIFFLIYIILGIVVILDDRYNVDLAEKVSVGLARRLQTFSHLLRLLFVNPLKPADRSGIFTVKFLFSSCTRLTSVGGEQSLAAMIATLCEAMEEEYGLVVTRLFRIFKPHTVDSGAGCLTRFKTLLCIPHFVIFAVVLLSLLSGTALLIIFPVPYNSIVLGVLIALASIIGLTLISNLWTWGRAIGALVRSQKSRVHRAAEKVNELKLDGFMQLLKREVDLMAGMVNIMDAFMHVQTRLVVIVDGLDSCEQEKVLNVLDTVKMLFSDDDTPFIVILAVDPQIIIKGINMTMRRSFQDLSVNGFDYLRNVVQLPFYLQSQGTKAPRAQSLVPSVSTDGEVGRPAYKREESSGGTNMDSVRQRRKPRNRAGAGSQMSLHASSFDLTNTLTKNDYFSDINPRSMRRLLNITAVTARLLRAYNIEFSWHRLAAWDYLIENWPYRVSWIIYYFEEEESVESSTTLYTLYQRVVSYIPVTKEMEPLLEIDRNTRKLEAVLKAESGSLPLLNVGDLRKFLPCTINLDPYLRKIIRETQQALELQMGEYSMGIPPGGPPDGGPPHMGGGRMGVRPSSSRMGPIASSVLPGPMGFQRRHPPSIPPQYPPVYPYAAHLAVPGATAPGVMIVPPSPYLPVSQSPSPSPIHQPLDCYIHDYDPTESLTKMSVGDICKLLKKLEGLNQDHIGDYSASLQEHNINGLVLTDCCLDELREVLRMRFGDWQLFRSMVTALREAESYRQVRGASPRLFSPASTADRVLTSSAPRTPDVVLKEQGPQGKGSKTDLAPLHRFKRADSIVQQLSVESALLANALEEFSADEGEDTENVDELESSQSHSDATVLSGVVKNSFSTPPHIQDSDSHASTSPRQIRLSETSKDDPLPPVTDQTQVERKSPKKPILKPRPLHRSFTPLTLREREAQDDDGSKFFQSDSSGDLSPPYPSLSTTGQSVFSPATSRAVSSRSSFANKHPQHVVHNPASSQPSSSTRNLPPSPEQMPTTSKAESGKNQAMHLGEQKRGKVEKLKQEDGHLAVQGRNRMEESYCSLDKIPSEVFEVVGEEPVKSDHILVDMKFDLSGSSRENSPSPDSPGKQTWKRDQNQSASGVLQDNWEVPTQRPVFTLTIEEDEPSSDGDTNAEAPHAFEASVEEYFHTRVRGQKSSSSKGDEESFV